MIYIFDTELEIRCCEDCPMLALMVEEDEELMSWCNLMQVEIIDEQKGRHILCPLRDMPCL